MQQQAMDWRYLLHMKPFFTAMEGDTPPKYGLKNGTVALSKDPAISLKGSLGNHLYSSERFI